ncbi:3-phosphoserine/phosphohydroxythreonine transaminase [Castellaniella caeni]|uniref:3-phosphoserine/phosphohydroxythreonine transaminase n=1 Tax=Castellaniella caeni TaxID=266123 RepID=UPI00082E7DCF|nr:3-phosphoserine/phosphohydroxythreonine transaminase [Castellaniella caeni]
MNRPWNFAAGPSTLPLEVLQQAAADMCDWQGSGTSVMEMSHRGKHYSRIRDEAEADLRALLAVPDDFEVLFMQGGASAQNALVPLNLIGRNGSGRADYVLSGHWARKSFNEAKRYGDIAVAASAEGAAEFDGRRYGDWCWLPAQSQWKVRADAAYLHLCANETIGGVEQAVMPDMAALGAPEVPLVADMSSNILSRPIDFSRLGLVYAGAQKNAGPAGVTLVFVRKDLIGHASAQCPSVFDYSNVAGADSMFNTPPTYAIYMAGLVFKWLLRHGGVAAMDAASAQKSQALYQYLDGSALYENRIQPAVRSRMNIPFFLRDESLNAAFLAESEAAGLLALKGHKSVGGMRASLYNAMPLEGVRALIAFLRDFEARHG